MAGTRRLAAIAVGLALFWQNPSAAAGATCPMREVNPTTYKGDQLAKELNSNCPVFHEGTKIHGLVDIRGGGTVSVPFVCRGCTFTHGIRAHHVRFERSVDLSGATIPKADLEGARFNEALLLGDATIVERANFAFTAFSDLADFARTSFRGRSDFSAARFEALARFSEAKFNKTAKFAAARFEREALFPDADIEEADFESAVFGRVTDFRATFIRFADFRSADFGGRADFSRAKITAAARFADTRFAAEALFVGAEVAAPGPSPPTATFENASVAGRLDFTAAHLQGITDLRRVSAGSLVFTETRFGKESALHMERVAATRLELSLDDVERIKTEDIRARDAQDDQERALKLIASTASAAGDVGLANDARYRLQAIASRDYGQTRRIADILLYRWVAGYLVRPLRPLLWLVGLVVLFSLVRTVLVEHRAERWQTLRVARASGRFVTQLIYTILPWSSSPDTPAHRRVELTVYATLLACFVVGLANSNPSLREIVEAVI